MLNGPFMTMRGLAAPRPRCHSAAMSKARQSRAGGVLIALGIVIGIVVGAILHEPSIGVLAGFGVGTLLALLVWLLDRRG